MMIIDLIIIMLMMIVEQKKGNLYIYGNDDVYHDVEWKKADLVGKNMVSAFRENWATSVSIFILIWLKIVLFIYNLHLWWA